MSPLGVEALIKAVLHEVTQLRAAFDDGAWAPSPGEQELAEGLCRAPWGAPAVRTALRTADAEVRGGRLVALLDPGVVLLLESSRAAETHGRLLPLRQLLDALTPPP